MADISQANYHLSVEAGSGFLFVMACNRQQRSCEDIEIISTEANTPLRFSSLLQKSPWLQSRPFSVSFSHCDLRSTLVPLELFEPSQKEKYLSLNCEISPADTTWHYTIHSIQSEIIFSIDTQLKRDFEKTFPSIVFRHSSSLMIDYIQSFINAKSTFYIQFYPGLMQLAVMENRRLLFFNSYTRKTPEDTIYYTLFVAEQLKLQPKDVRITLMGEVMPNDDTHQMLNRYFGDVGFCAGPQGITFGEKMKHHPQHRFIQLINQFKCEL